MIKSKSSKGFTLLEVLLVIGLIAILAGIVIVAINPGRQIGQANDTQKSADVNTILNAVYQYTIDNQGTLPGGISSEVITTSLKIIGTQVNACTDVDWCPDSPSAPVDCIDLGDTLVGTTKTYLTDMPINPNSNADNTYDAAETGYYVLKDGNDRVTVGSCENDVDGGAITVTR